MSGLKILGFSPLKQLKYNWYCTYTGGTGTTPDITTNSFETDLLKDK